MQTPSISSDVEPDTIPLACNLNAIDDQHRPRHVQLVQRLLLAPERDCHELANGYTFRFARDAQVIMDVAEFITYESLCCPFFTFTLEVEPDGVLAGGGPGHYQFATVEAAHVYSVECDAARFEIRGYANYRQERLERHADRGVAAFFDR